MISKDESFRPVSLYNAPDGSLYVLDLRKGVIQHRAYMTSYLREKILKKRLDTINGKGRIYRVASSNHPLKIPESSEDQDGLNYLAGKSLDEVNEKAWEGTAQAHLEGGVPNMTLMVKDRSAHTLGYLFYFFPQIASIFIVGRYSRFCFPL